MPIRDYAAIGDGRTAALVARDGSIDWLCLPELDSPSVFAAALDADRGGRFALEPETEAHVERRYLPDARAYARTDPASGRPRWAGSDAMAIRPVFGYGARAPRLESRGGTPVATHGPHALAVCSWDAGKAHVDEQAISGRFEAPEGSSALIALCAARQEPLVSEARGRRGTLGGNKDVLAP